MSEEDRRRNQEVGNGEGVERLLDTLVLVEYNRVYRISLAKLGRILYDLISRGLVNVEMDGTAFGLCPCGSLDGVSPVRLHQPRELFMKQVISAWPSI